MCLGVKWSIYNKALFYTHVTTSYLQRVFELLKCSVRFYTRFIKRVTAALRTCSVRSLQPESHFYQMY